MGCLNTVINIVRCDIISTVFNEFSTSECSISDKRYISVKITENSVDFLDKVQRSEDVFERVRLVKIVMDPLQLAVVDNHKMRCTG